MTEFETSGSVTIEVDQGSLRDARQEIEDEIGSVTVQARRESSGNVGPPRTDGGVSSMGLAGGGGLLEELNNQTELLDDIHEELQKSGVSGGGGGGGGSGGGGGGLRDMATGGMLARSLGSLGAGGALGGLASRLAPSTALGGAATGLGLGLGGVNALDRLGVMQDTEQFGESVGQNSPQWARDASNFVPGMSGAAALPGISQAIFGGSQHGGDGTFLGNRMAGAERAGEDFSTIWERRAEILGEGTGDVYPGDVGEDGSPEQSPYGGIPDREAGINQTHTAPVGGRTPDTQRRNREAADRAAEAREERRRTQLQQQAEESPAQNLSRRQRQAREEQQRRESLQQQAESSPAPNLSQRQREARAQAREQSESSGSSPPSPGEQQQTAQITNDITIEMSSMQETMSEVERMIQEAVQQFGQDLGSGAPGRFGP